MMNKILYFFGIFLLLGAMGACGSSKSSKASDENKEKSDEIILKPYTTKITGPLGNAFTVVEREYKSKGDFAKLNVEIEVTDISLLPEGVDLFQVGTPSNEGDEKYPLIATFIVEYLDEDGNVIETKDAQEGIGRLLRLKNGDTGTLTYYLPYKKENVTHFRVISDLYPNEIKESRSSTVSDDATLDISIDKMTDEEFDKALERTKKAAETVNEIVDGASKLLKHI